MINFGQVTEVVEKSGNLNLEPNMIHEVKLASIVAEGETYLDITFENNNGSHRHRMFAWTSDDLTEKPGFNGGKNPSRAAQDYAVLKQLGDAVGIAVPDSFENWLDFRKKMIVAFTPAIGKELKIKLLENSKGYAALPSFPLSYASEAKGGNLYTKTSIFANKDGRLTFTRNEQAKIDEKNNATPTSVNDTSNGFAGFSQEASAVAEAVVESQNIFSGF